ncbi:competence type IV pilus minor pilin ComGG [Peribacillus sp. NPDC097675]|uniref:competence type IV pilus minor pilin ComGG n=1 Tax=Peribacillus sp. NPDC097675 TaxID=3390618 RepID=UPI003CFEFD95
MNNQKGVVFPMVMIIASVFIMFSILMIDQFVIDKKFYKEVEETEISDHLVHLAVNEVTAEWDGELPKSIQGDISYPNGDVHYKLTKQDVRYAYIEFASLSRNNRTSRIIILYDKKIGRVIEWIEKLKD